MPDPAGLIGITGASLGAGVVGSYVGDLDEGVGEGGGLFDWMCNE